MKLEEYLRFYKVSQADFACQLGVSQPYVYFLVSGKRKASKSLAKKIEQHSFKYKLGSGLIVIWLLMIILLLSSRMTILATIFILGVSFLIWMLFYNNRKRYVYSLLL